MILARLFTLGDMLALAGVLWIAIIILGGYADDSQNYLIPFFVGVMYLTWRFL